MFDTYTGRFMQEDPDGFAAGDLNLYRYVHNQPTGGTDPSGLQAAGAVSPSPLSLRGHQTARWAADEFVAQLRRQGRTVSADRIALIQRAHEYAQILAEQAAGDRSVPDRAAAVAVANAALTQG